MSTLRKQIKAWKENKDILDTNGKLNGEHCWNFYDWFCRDESLERKAKSLMPKVVKFVEANPWINLDRHYCWFKNNCPMDGKLYDDFRISHIEEGEVLFTVIPRCGHNSTPDEERASVWGSQNGFDGPMAVAENWTKLNKKY